MKTIVIASVAGLLIFVGVLVYFGQEGPEAKLPALPATDTRQGNATTINNDLPQFLQQNFPSTDFDTTDPAINTALSGTPNKDNIPALTNPAFIALPDSQIADEVQTIALLGDEGVKLYPYNILTWHEIVNDTFDGTPVAVTFCPLCGSAITYNREVNGEVLEFGVSGALIESNMVMYDRTNENLWQQSTGEGLTGMVVGQTLELYPMQLTTVGEARTKYPDARILSVDTGHSRDYGRNPYSGYDTDNEQFLFQLSEFSLEFPAKEIMVVFKVGEQVVTTPWNSIPEEQQYTVDGTSILLQKRNSELVITNSEGVIIPFYFEMWFSVAVQHGEEVLVI